MNIVTSSVVVASRFLESGTIQPPPRMLTAIVEWAVKTIMQQLWVDLNNLDQIKFGQIGVSPEILGELRTYTNGKLREPRLEKEFKTVLKDWPYAKSIRGSDRKIVSIGVEITSLSNAYADFDKDSYQMRVSPPYLDELPKSGLQPWLRTRLERAIRHELQHFAQVLLETAKDLEPGLLSKHIRTPDGKVDGWGGGQYELSDEEFQPLLEDAKLELRDAIRVMPNVSPRAIFNTMTGLDHPIPGIVVNPLFSELKKSGPEGEAKYRRALKELSSVL